MARHRVSGGTGPSESAYAELPVLAMGQAQTRYFISLDVTDEPGVLAAVAAVFAEHGVSIETVRQHQHDGDPHDDRAALVIVTHGASDAALAATVDDLAELEAVREVASVMRVEGN